MNIEVEESMEETTYSTSIQCPVCGMTEQQIATNGFDFDHRFEHFFKLEDWEAVGPVAEYPPNGVLVCRECGTLFYHSKHGYNADIVRLQKGNLWKTS